MKTTKHQIVYLFRHKGTNHVKIGMTTSNDCTSRFQSFCTYAPNGGEIVGTIKTDNARKLEKELHIKYDQKRLNGEFFELTQKECEDILKNNKSKLVDEIVNKVMIAESEGRIDLLKKINSLFAPLKSVDNSEKNVISEYFSPSLDKKNDRNRS